MEFFTFAWLTDPTLWVSLITLMALEIVPGIDNLVFISILAGRLPENQQAKARKVGLALALLTRLMLLATLAWIVSSVGVEMLNQWARSRRKRARTRAARA